MVQNKHIQIHEIHEHIYENTCLDLFFGCLDLYWGVWTCISGLWTCIWVSGLVFGCWARPRAGTGPRTRTRPGPGPGPGLGRAQDHCNRYASGMSSQAGLAGQNKRPGATWGNLKSHRYAIGVCNRCMQQVCNRYAYLLHTYRIPIAYLSPIGMQ